MKSAKFGLAAPLLFLMFALPGSASTTYMISFSTSFGGGPAPTAGSFDYDGATFTAFTVTWENLTWDLTAAANAPFLFSGGLGCNSEGSNPQFGFLLMSKTAIGCIASIYQWSGQDVAPGSGFSASFSMGLYSGTNPSDSMGAPAQTGNLPPASLVQTGGGWTIQAETPEPEPLGLMLFGTLAVALRHYYAGKRRKSFAGIRGSIS